MKNFNDTEYKEVIREHFLTSLDMIEAPADFIDFALYEFTQFPGDFDFFKKVVANNHPEFSGLFSKLTKLSNLI